ncbi:MAG: chloramphenicol acetyltransferase [Pyrinomonadaceae bacterium]
MFKEVDLESWNRRETFEFFKDFEDPFFNIAAHLDATELYRFCKKKGLSFSLAGLFYSLKTANEIREFRLRMKDEKVIEFEKVDATQTILNEDETFSFAYFPLKENVFDFVASGRRALDKYKALKTFDVESDRIDLIYYSVIPWISFTSFKHAVRFDNRQTVPRIVFGRMYDDQGGRKKIPLSVEVHHALVDGFHVGKYFNRLQEKFEKPV